MRKMSLIKTSEEIRRMKEGGRRLFQVLEEVLRQVKPGVSLTELDRLAERLIKRQEGWPSFKMVANYSWATCINVNDGVVHGIPNDYRLKEGDLVSLDVGMFYRGRHTDVARTFYLPTKKEERVGKKEEFLKAGRKALEEAVKAARPGNRVGHISLAIEREIKKKRFSPISSFTGHGVGRRLHEEPQIPCFLRGGERELAQTPLLKPGMTLAIEVIYSQGRPDLVLDDDGWTLRTADGSWAGLFEDTVLVTKTDPVVLTSS